MAVINTFLFHSRKITLSFQTIIHDNLLPFELTGTGLEKEVLPGFVYYIPHSKEVLKEDKATSKVQVVYDASAKFLCKPSLNDCLLLGPSLTPLIFDILLRFRLHKAEVIGDLEKVSLKLNSNQRRKICDGSCG